MIKDIVTDKNQLEIACVPVLDMALAGMIINDLIDTASHWQTQPIGCLGLSANQIGYPYNVFIMWHCGNWQAMINPEVIWESPEIMKKGEGCLSFPKIKRKMTRNKKITVRFTALRKKDPLEIRYTGMTARIIQHEMDHLVGKHI